MGKVFIYYFLIDKSQIVLMFFGLVVLMKVIFTWLKGIKLRDIEKSCLRMVLVI